MAKQLLSIVLPSHNEEKNLPLVYEEILKNIDFKRFVYEVIFVNDGSIDDTWSVIQRLVAKDANVSGINFSRNYGHAAALEAGLTRARGDVVIMMDADLQHPPTVIPQLIKSYDEGNDIVNTVRLTTQDTGLMKSLTSKMFYWFINNISELNLREGEADFRLLSRSALDVLNALPESPKFYRGLVNWIGFTVARVDYIAVRRVHGHSSYTVKKMVELARLGVTSFSMKPLKIIFSIGVSLTLVAFVLLVVMLILKFFIDPELISYNAIITDCLLLATGILTIFQGTIALYLIDIFSTIKGRPTYIIKNEAKSNDKK